MKLTVLSVAYPLAPVSPDAAGGSEQILSLLDRELTRAGHHSIVIACKGSVAEGTLIETPRPRGTLSNKVREQAHKHYWKAIGSALEKYPVDLVHLHGLDFYCYMPYAGVPVLATLHLPPDWYPSWIFRIKRPQTWLHCVSAAQRRACPRSKILLPEIENGVPVDELKPNGHKRSYALALGRICPEKGYHLALDAAIQAKMPLVIAGEIFKYRAHERYFKQEIEPRLTGNGRRFIGPVGFRKKRELLAGARCLLIPSLVQETSSLVAMEALACGTPVVAFPSGALAEIVEHGKTGFLVNDEQEMAEAINAVDSLDPQDCRRAAQKRFAASRMVAQYMERYQTLVRTTKKVRGAGNHSA